MTLSNAWQTWRHGANSHSAPSLCRNWSSIRTPSIHCKAAQPLQLQQQPSITSHATARHVKHRRNLPGMCQQFTLELLFKLSSNNSPCRNLGSPANESWILCAIQVRNLRSSQYVHCLTTQFYPRRDLQICQTLLSRLHQPTRPGRRRRHRSRPGPPTRQRR